MPKNIRFLNCNYRLNLIFIFLLFFLTIFSTIVLAVEYPVTVIDDLGNEITLARKPERIISLAPNITEMLFSLGLGEQIVGVSSFADYPVEALKKEKVGTITDPNIEKIIALEPDLVIAAEVNKLETLDQLRNLGITVAGFAPASIEDTLILLEKVGRLTGNIEQANSMVAELSADLSKIELLVEQVLEDRDRPKVFYEIWSDPLFTAGENTFIDDIIKTAGGINLAGKAKGAWPQYNFEQLLLDSPDVYISSLHSATEEVTIESIKERPNYDQLKAVKNGQIYVIDQNFISRPSPRILEGLKLLVKALFPELIGKIDQL